MGSNDTLTLQYCRHLIFRESIPFNRDTGVDGSNLQGSAQLWPGPGDHGPLVTTKCSLYGREKARSVRGDFKGRLHSEIVSNDTIKLNSVR